MKTVTAVLVGVLALLAGCKPSAGKKTGEPEWVALFNGRNLDGWFMRGSALWGVREGVVVGSGGLGYLYASPVLTDLEVRGLFRVSANGNGGLCFRAGPPLANENDASEGYEAQIENHQAGFTGSLWRPGRPIAPANKLLAKDNEWFSLRVKAIGNHIQIWVNDELVTDHQDGEYGRGYIAIQSHHAGMVIEAKDLYYRDWGGRSG
jgi:hypothetical protein